MTERSFNEAGGQVSTPLDSYPIIGAAPKPSLAIHPRRELRVFQRFPNKKRAGDVYDAFAGSNPRYAVCYVVLNLLFAGWDLAEGFRLGRSLSRLHSKLKSPIFGVGSEL